MIGMMKVIENYREMNREIEGGETLKVFVQTTVIAGFRTFDGIVLVPDNEDERRQLQKITDASKHAVPKGEQTVMDLDTKHLVNGFIFTFVE